MYCGVKRQLKYFNSKSQKKILDIATGTADFAIAAAQTKPQTIVGIDIAQQMLDIGTEKIKNKGLQQLITLQLGDSEQLNFETNEYDAITCSFGVRNFENLELGLKEMHRVLKPNGQLIIMEFSKPEGIIIKPIFSFYFKYILPLIGKIISKDNSAYTYLPESVNAFPYGKKFTDILSNCGFKELKCTPLSFGIASIYSGTK